MKIDRTELHRDPTVAAGYRESAKGDGPVKIKVEIELTAAEVREALARFVEDESDYEDVDRNSLVVSVANGNNVSFKFLFEENEDALAPSDDEEDE